MGQDAFVEKANGVLGLIPFSVFKSIKKIKQTKDKISKTGFKGLPQLCTHHLEIQKYIK